MVHDTPGCSATTPDEIARAFADQAPTDATAPVDVTAGEYSGKAVTVRVPMSYDLPGSDREAEFADATRTRSRSTEQKADGSDLREMWEAGQIDEFWFLDVEGSIVILDLSYSPAAPDDLVEAADTRRLGDRLKRPDPQVPSRYRTGRPMGRPVGPCFRPPLRPFSIDRVGAQRSIG